MADKSWPVSAVANGVGLYNELPEDSVRSFFVSFVSFVGEVDSWKPVRRGGLKIDSGAGAGKYNELQEESLRSFFVSFVSSYVCF